MAMASSSSPGARAGAVARGRRGCRCVSSKMRAKSCRTAASSRDDARTAAGVVAHVASVCVLMCAPAPSAASNDAVMAALAKRQVGDTMASGGVNARLHLDVDEAVRARTLALAGCVCDAYMFSSDFRQVAARWRVLRCIA